MIGHVKVIVKEKERETIGKRKGGWGSCKIRLVGVVNYKKSTVQKVQVPLLVIL